MDVIALLVFVGGFAVCAAMVFLVSVFGVKEQTYEEALALQRRKNDKGKSKDRKKDGSFKKKSQKWNKRKENGIASNDANHEDIAEVVEQVFVETEDLPHSSEDEHNTVTEEFSQVAEELPQVTNDQIKVEGKKTPQSNPLKNKKSKIIIKDVDEVVIDEDMVVMAPEEKTISDSMMGVVEVEESAKPPAIKAEASKPSPNIAKKISKKQNSAKHVSNSKELLTIVEKTIFNDLEAQQIIDVILNKQGDGLCLGGGGGWVEKGKLSETAKLQKQLGEAEVSLQEEVAKAQSLKDKMVELRRELNEDKSAKAAWSRTVEEIKASHAQEITNLNTKLSGAHCDLNLLQTQLNQQVQQQNQLEENQAHFQGIIDSLNLQLEISNVAVGTASATAAGERDKSRALREEFEADMASMREQLMFKTEEAMTMGREAMKLGEVRREMEQVMASKAQLNSEVARLQAENSNLMSAKENAMILEKQLKDVTEKLGDKATETARLEKEIDEMKLKIETDAADESFKIELDAAELKADTLEKEIDELKLSQVGDCTQAELEVMTKKAEDLKKELESCKKELKQTMLEADIKENEIVNLKKKQFINELKSTTKGSDSKIDLLSRLFPNLDTSASSDELEAAIKQHLATSLEARRNEDTDKLEAQVTHYKNTLDQTETMLKSLQASVEDQEGKWMKKLEAATEDLEQVKSLNGTKDHDANSGGNTEDSDTKWEELLNQLTKEKEEKKEALEKLSKMEKWNESETKKGLVSSNALLSKLLMVGQQALDKETQTVNALKSQLAKSTGKSKLTQL